jgi:transcriptional regulator with XRE-family HTH domain
MTDSRKPAEPLRGHALRNAHLRERSLARSQSAPELARAVVRLRAETLGLTRLELARRSGISRGTLRDLELGVHVPTRSTLQRFVDFCQKQGVPPEHTEELRRLYAGSADNLTRLIARLELLAGSPRELARRVGISTATLWEYRRGHFPIPLAILLKLCAAVSQDEAAATVYWRETEKKRLLNRGYPEALADFWVLCARKGYTEKQVLGLGLSTAAARRMRYLEIPPWPAVAKTAKSLCDNDEELLSLEQTWLRGEREQGEQARRDFGFQLRQLRKQRGVSRRQLADMFDIRGKKPARIIKNIEEDGFFSMQAYPAGMVALLTDDEAEWDRLLESWRQRRLQFHMRHRPETRTDLRLAREQFGFELTDMRPILGYTSLEYQKIERGVSPLLDTARQRILEAIARAGRERLEALLQQRRAREARRDGWRWPASVAEMIALLARREGGMIPLARYLKRSGVRGLWAGRLRSLARGQDLPSWCAVERLGRVAGVSDLSQVYLDWVDRYRAQLRREGRSPLGVEVRVLIGEVAVTLRDFSPRLGFNDSVLVRDLQRLDRDDRVRWYHIERILRAAGLSEDDDRRREIRGLWATSDERRRNGTLSKMRTG